MSAEAKTTIGPWTCGELLGRGGNATVWRAQRDGKPEQVALKVVNAKKAHAEPYQRFVREIGFLRGLGEYPGVLPLLDAHLPANPGGQDRAWLAMPIATPIRAALAQASIAEIVQAVSVIADTLARLSAEHGMGHRDIKPGNLYERGGEFLVGDFGLIDIPDVEELTRSGRSLGPAHFTAYEVIVNPATAAAGPADVFSLGKTLWVLATDVQWPPLGYQPADSRGYAIADHRSHRHVAQLDALVDRMTRLDPAARPTMQQAADDLRAWLDLSAAPVAVDVSDLRATIRAKLADEIANRDLQEERKQLAHQAVRSLQEHTRPLNDALREIHPGAEIDGRDKLSENLLRTRAVSGSPEILFSWVRCSTISTGERSPYALRMGRSVELTADGRLLARWLLDVGRVKTMGNDFHAIERDYAAPVGSVEQERMLQRFTADLGKQLANALAVFAAKAPSPEG